MRYNKNIMKSLIIFLLTAIILSSCRKENGPDYDYFVSKDLSFSLSRTNISTIIDNAAVTYPELDDLKPLLTTGINVYKMFYNTTVDGEVIEASGLVCMPDEAGDYPVLSFQNGTNTLNSNAPSENPANISYQLVEYIASMGFIVVIPDYPGFGRSDNIPHPYLIAEPTVQSVIDMLRALKEGVEYEFAGLNVKNEYYLFGYSQGGWATLALHKALELEYFDEFTLAGSVCGAGPYNIYNLLLHILSLQEYPMPSYLCYIINAYSSYNQFTNPVSDLLNAKYAALLPTLFNGTMSLSQINSQLTTSISGLFKQDFLSGYTSSIAYTSVREAVTNNSVSAWNSSVPVFFGHGDGDTDVSMTATETMYNEMISAGTSDAICKKVIYPGLDHGEAVIPCIKDGLLFLLDIRDK